jgi:hypothetical protein
MRHDPTFKDMVFPKTGEKLPVELNHDEVKAD